jgi:hypothetical protein
VSNQEKYIKTSGSESTAVSRGWVPLVMAESESAGFTHGELLMADG